MHATIYRSIESMWVPENIRRKGRESTVSGTERAYVGQQGERYRPHEAQAQAELEAHVEALAMGRLRGHKQLSDSLIRG